MQMSAPTLMSSTSSRTEESNSPASCWAFFSSGGAGLVAAGWVEVEETVCAVRRVTAVVEMRVFPVPLFPVLLEGALSETPEAEEAAEAEDAVVSSEEVSVNDDVPPETVDWAETFDGVDTAPPPAEHPTSAKAIPVKKMDNIVFFTQASPFLFCVLTSQNPDWSDRLSKPLLFRFGQISSATPPLSTRISLWFHSRYTSVADGFFTSPPETLYSSER